MLKTKQIHVCTVDDILIRNRGNQSKTARDLNISRSNLALWIKDKELKKKLVQVEIHGDFEEKLTIINHKRDRYHGNKTKR